MKKNFFLLFLLVSMVTASGQASKIKNIILMIPDGTSLATYSSARWYQWYNNPDKPNLHIDPYICGTVLTFSSNAPIGDSAPTTSCYMTGVPGQPGYVSTYPPVDEENDIFPLDSSRTYQPLMTLLEAAKIVNHMAVGLVFTCEFPHATPADCSAHSYDRGKYRWIVPQMIHNDLDVVIGGGVSYLDDAGKKYLQDRGCGVFTDDLTGFRSYKGNKMWSLFCEKEMPYDLDRDPQLYPSLAEMTAVAIEKLSSNDNGFFLMVEGSKIDWAAHANDPIAMITDCLAFDEACGVAFDFAEKNGETLVIMVSDHGNSGISIGSDHCKKSYSSRTKTDLFGSVSDFKITGEGLIKKIHQTEPEKITGLFKEYMNIDLREEEFKSIVTCKDYSKSALSDEERMRGNSLNKVVSTIVNERTCFGFTTTGHTGEEVLLAVYDPTPDRKSGFMTNMELNNYMARSIGLEGRLPELTDTYFAKHTDVFAGYKYTVKPSKEKNEEPLLEVSGKKNKLLITPNTNIVMHNKKEVKLNSVVVYVDKNNTFYLPEHLKELLH